MMPLSTRGRYAARIMVFLSRKNGGGPATKGSIGASEEISPDYVEQIMMGLKAAGLVQSHRGRKGGFSLARNADAITLSDVLLAVEGPVSPVPCVAKECSRSRTCPTRPIWKKTAHILDALFRETTIGQLAADAEASQNMNILTYEI